MIKFFIILKLGIRFRGMTLEGESQKISSNFISK
jgi:hypothetical protein